MIDTHATQDHSLDESTSVNPQHFDEEGYVVGHPHHTAVTGAELTPDGHLIDTPPPAPPLAPPAPPAQPAQ